MVPYLQHQNEEDNTSFQTFPVGTPPKSQLGWGCSHLPVAIRLSCTAPNAQGDAPELQQIDSDSRTMEMGISPATLSQLAEATTLHLFAFL